MKIYLSSLENYKELFEYCEDNYLKYGLISYYYLKNQETLDKILKKVDYLLIDSGAHTFQYGKKVNFDDFTKKYAEFIKKNTDNPQIIGFFEMDIDNIVGYEKVLQLRQVLEKVSDKIIPVWHKNRGINDYIEMCKKYSGKRVAFGCKGDKDINVGQHNLFINTAHKYNCKIHLLGLTRYELIKTLNLGKEDSVDSSTWKQCGIYGTIQLPKKDGTRELVYSMQGIRKKQAVFDFINFNSAKKIQEIYDEFDNKIIIGG